MNFKLYTYSSPKHGSLHYSPIHFMRCTLTPLELCALYWISSACIVTSIRDGMNLVCMEYVAVQEQKSRAVALVRANKDLHNIRESPEDTDGPGCVILSEFTGAAKLISASISVNPWNADNVAAGIHTSLTMKRRDKELRHRKFFQYIATHNCHTWSKSFIATTQQSAAEKNENPIRALPVANIVDAYVHARRRLIIADYDGTLSPLESQPALASPAPYLKRCIQELSEDPRTTVIVMSGRGRHVMEQWFGDLPIGLAAEHGCFIRFPSQSGKNPPWRLLCDGESREDAEWKNVIRPVMNFFLERTPGSSMEERECSMAWHYRDAATFFGTWQAKEMCMHLSDVTSKLPLDVWLGNRVVEVRWSGANKSTVVAEALRFIASKQRSDHSYRSGYSFRGQKKTYGRGNKGVDFVMCVGDDKSDEDMFKLLKAIKMGLNNNEERIKKISPVKDSSLSNEMNRDNRRNELSLGEIDLRESTKRRSRSRSNSRRNSTDSSSLIKAGLVANDAELYSCIVGLGYQGQGYGRVGPLTETTHAEFRLDSTSDLVHLLNKFNASTKKKFRL